jgi:hypothetical protein
VGLSQVKVIVVLASGFSSEAGPLPSN